MGKKKHHGRVTRHRPAPPDEKGSSNEQDTQSESETKDCNLECFTCQQLFSYESLEMNEFTFQSIVQLAPFGARWHCSTCLENHMQSEPPQISAESIKGVIKNEITTIINNFDAKIDILKSTFLSKVESIQQSNTSYANVVTQNLSKQSEAEEVMVKLTKNVESLTNNVVSERTEKSEAHFKKVKKDNIVVFKMPEADESSPIDAYKTDFSNILKVIDPNNQFDKEDIVDLYRIPCNQTPRPICIKFKSNELKYQVLKMQDLKIVVNGTEHRIFTAPDRTKKEQEQHRKLVSERNERRKKGESNLIIRGGKIVEGDNRPFRFKPHEYWGEETSS